MAQTISLRINEKGDRIKCKVITVFLLLACLFASLSAIITGRVYAAIINETNVPGVHNITWLSQPAFTAGVRYGDGAAININALFASVWMAAFAALLGIASRFLKPDKWHLILTVLNVLILLISAIIIFAVKSVAIGLVFSPVDDNSGNSSVLYSSSMCQILNLFAKRRYHLSSDSACHATLSTCSIMCFLASVLFLIRASNISKYVSEMDHDLRVSRIFSKEYLAAIVSGKSNSKLNTSSSTINHMLVNKGYANPNSARNSVTHSARNSVTSARNSQVNLVTFSSSSSNLQAQGAGGTSYTGGGIGRSLDTQKALHSIMHGTRSRSKSGSRLP